MNKPLEQEIRGIRVNAVAGQRPCLVDGVDTCVALFANRCAELGDRTAHREKDFGIWQSYSWADYYNAAKNIGLGFAKLGLKRGEVVSILSEDRKEWLYLDMGIQCMGGIASGVYTTDSSSQLEYLLRDSGSTFLVVENDEQLDKFLEIADQATLIKKVIIMDDDGLQDLNDDRFMFLDELYEIGAAHAAENPDMFEASIKEVKPSDTGLLIYTSGTTGAPKGAMLNQENIMAAVESGIHSVTVFETDEQLCFLPLSHVLERSVSVYGPISTRCIVNFAESPETVFDNLQELSPHTFTAVPRVWEKVYSRVLVLAQESTTIGRMAYGLAIKAGMKRAEAIIANKPVPAMVSANYALWDFLVLKNLRRMLGMDRIRRATTGAAPISPELLKWYTAIGVNLLEGYGMTENAGICSINRVGANKIGTVGQAVAGVELKIAEDGEILTKGLNSFKGYWRNNEKTAETFTDDGWLRTGDVGNIDADGYLSITGRLKDIIITAGGKNITPAEIESRLKFSHYISDAVVIGDRRKYLTCLVMIDQENVEKFAQDGKIPFSDFASLCAASEINALIKAEVEAVNKEFARVEQIKDFRLINVLLTAEDDELTATMKLKRGLVEKKHNALIEQMYS
jgi:long-chain acyl-CoA synthetase